MPLTAKQAAFVREYLVDLNATQAAIRAGYSRHTAGATSHENLKKPEIAAAIEAEKGLRAARTRIDMDTVLHGILAQIRIQEKPTDICNAKGVKIGEGVTAPAGAVILKGYELLGRYLGLWNDKLSHVGMDGKPLSNTIKIEFVDGPGAPPDELD